MLGVAPLLLMQVTFAVSFFTAVNLLAPWWMSIIALLIVAFLSFDILGHGIATHRRHHLLVALAALSCLLAVPGILAAVLVIVENPDKWQSIALSGFHLVGKAGGALALSVSPCPGGGSGHGGSIPLFLHRAHETGKVRLTSVDDSRITVPDPSGGDPVCVAFGKTRSPALIALIAGAVGAGLLLMSTGRLPPRFFSVI